MFNHCVVLFNFKFFNMKNKHFSICKSCHINLTVKWNIQYVTILDGLVSRWWRCKCLKKLQDCLNMKTHFRPERCWKCFFKRSSSTLWTTMCLCNHVGILRPNQIEPTSHCPQYELHNMCECIWIRENYYFDPSLRRAFLWTTET